MTTATGRRFGRAFVERVRSGPWAAPASARQATPESGGGGLGLPHGERTYTMFVQTARAGTWVPDAQEEGTYSLTLTGLPAQTVYFSDRPQRIVGIQATDDFLSNLGFGADNPPNAALVTTADDGAADILVIELFDPGYSQGDGGGTLQYRARILENFVGTNLGHVVFQQNDAAIPAAFEGASLFIDDCPDGRITCLRGSKPLGAVNFGCCYSFPSCQQCHDETGICRQIAGCEDGGCVERIGKECPAIP